MKEPLFPSKPGDPIRSDIWNQLQSRLRQEIYDQVSSHAHKGDEQSRKIGGDAIDATSVIAAKELSAADKLSIGSLNVGDTLAQASAQLAQMNTQLAQMSTQISSTSTTLTQVNTQLAQRLPLTGGTLTGALTVNNGMFTATAGATLSGPISLTNGVQYMGDGGLYLRAFPDKGHGIVYSSTFGGLTVDGAAVFGTNGGVLGSTASSVQRAALRWDANLAVSVKGTLQTDGLFSASNGANIAKELGMQGSNILLKVPGDLGHGLGWFHTASNKAFFGLSSYTTDGPVLWGWTGGALATLQGGPKLALTWDNNTNVRVSGTLFVDGPIRFQNQPFRVTQVFNQIPGPLPKVGNFQSGGGTLIIMASGSGWSWPSGGIIGMKIVVDGQLRGQAQLCSNETNTHRPYNSNPLVLTGIAAGNHQLSLDRLTGTTCDDVNDFYSVTVLELPL